MKITNDRFNLIMNNANKEINSLVAPKVIKVSPNMPNELDFLSIKNEKEASNQLYGIMNVDSPIFANDDDYLEWVEKKNAYKKDYLSLFKKNEFNFIADTKKSVDWNIRGFNRNLLEMYNTKIEVYRKTSGSSILNDYDKINEYKQNITNIYGKVLKEKFLDKDKFNIFNEWDNEGYPESILKIFYVKLDPVPITIYDLLNEQMSTNVNYKRYKTKLSPYLMKKSIRRFLYKSIDPLDYKKIVLLATKN